MTTPRQHELPARTKVYASLDESGAEIRSREVVDVIGDRVRYVYRFRSGGNLCCVEETASCALSTWVKKVRRGKLVPVREADAD